MSTIDRGMLLSYTMKVSAATSTSDQLAVGCEFSFTNDAPAGATIFLLCGFTQFTDTAATTPDAFQVVIRENSLTGTRKYIAHFSRATSAVVGNAATHLATPIPFRKPTSGTPSIFVNIENFAGGNWGQACKLYAWGVWV